MDIAAIIETPEDYGFNWAYGKIEKDSMVLSAQAPHIVITDVAKFQDKFPGIILNVLNGSNSVRVGCQSITRSTLWADRNTTPETLKQKCLAWLLGVKAATVTTVEVYVLPDGSKTKDKAEALKAWSEANH